MLNKTLCTLMMVFFVSAANSSALDKGHYVAHGDMTSAGELRYGIEYSCIPARDIGYAKIVLGRELGFNGTPREDKPSRLAFLNPGGMFHRFTIMENVVVFEDPPQWVYHRERPRDPDPPTTRRARGHRARGGGV